MKENGITADAVNATETKTTESASTEKKSSGAGVKTKMPFWTAGTLLLIAIGKLIGFVLILLLLKWAFSNGLYESLVGWIRPGNARQAHELATGYNPVTNLYPDGTSGEGNGYELPKPISVTSDGGVSIWGNPNTSLSGEEINSMLDSMLESLN